MSKTEEKVEKYVQDIKDKMGEDPDVDLLRKVTLACGPSIFQSDAETISSSSPEELETVKQNFMIKKLGLKDDKNLDAGLELVIEKYGTSNRNKYRAVVYYLLTKFYKKEAIFN
ncbi:DUF2853 family protein [Salinimicrobium flavum]|uniref:DUF2853 family protein n=1 Tax=Salinimicrobium flavum TaxID=1737065 RepID=A0ABW5IYM6_9FLAO